MRTAPLLAALALPLTACVTPEADNPQDAFWEALSSHCGKAYAGGLASDQEADAEMRGVEMTMHVRECSETRIAVPFHVRQQDGSWDRSRTWLITRTASGLRLKHDHRHEDGSEDVLTQYGGDTVGSGTETRQEFPADAFSRDLFARQNIPVSIANVWAVEADTPRATFTYELRRPNRYLRVEFDLDRPVPAPPPPWGSG